MSRSRKTFVHFLSKNFQRFHVLIVFGFWIRKSSLTNACTIMVFFVQCDCSIVPFTKIFLCSKFFYTSCILLVLPPFQNICYSDFSGYNLFVMHLDIYYVHIYNKSHNDEYFETRIVVHKRCNSASPISHNLDHIFSSLLHNRNSLSFSCSKKNRASVAFHKTGEITLDSDIRWHGHCPFLGFLEQIYHQTKPASTANLTCHFSIILNSVQPNR